MNLQSGTLFATPDAGHARRQAGTRFTITANFPFRVEFAQLTGSTPAPLPDQVACSGAGPGYSVSVDLPDVADGSEHPSYKYTIKGDGEAAGRVLDPIIIVDRKPGH